MPDSQSGQNQTGDRYTTNYQSNGGWRGTATIVTLILNLLFLFGIVFGGMKWVTEVNSNMAVFQTQQAIALQAIREIQDFDAEQMKRHAVEDALYPEIAKRRTR